jgi:hypothetical protein
MVRMSLREERASSWSGFHGHGRPWEQGAAPFRGGGQEESVRKWRVRRNEAKGRRWPAKLLYRGRMGGCLHFDWLRWVAAHLIVGVVGRQSLQEKKVRSTIAGRICHANTMAGSIFLPNTSEQ